MTESCPKLLDLIPKNKEWLLNRESDEQIRNGSSSDDNNKLELRLGLPGDDCWLAKNKSLTSTNHLLKQGLTSTNYVLKPWSCSSSSSYQPNSVSTFHHHQYQTVPKDLQKNAEKKAFSPPSDNTAVPNSSQKRAAPAPVVGWPPIRSFRKNLGSNGVAKSGHESQDAVPSKPLNEKPGAENSLKGLFVKINMDGVPIGRKVDLKAYDSYGKLSSAVDQLFRGLLAAQTDPSDGLVDNKHDEQKPITGLLDGSGEYTLVYEDNEGDRMLVGDVPWHMFVSTVKRLRVLKSSDLPSLNRGGSKEGKVRVESASKLKEAKIGF